MLLNVKNSVSKSWFCVFNNPEKYGYVGEPEKVVERVIEEWVGDSDTRTCAVNFCISAEGLNHLHAVFEDKKAMRFSAIKKLFKSMHIEPTKGNKEQAEDYINKRGKFEEKGEVIVYQGRHGEIKGAQGQRKDLERIEELILDGFNPQEIMDLDFSYRKFSNIIKEGYYRKRSKETPPLREVKVYWHIGVSGSGKSYTYVQLCEEMGEENIYFLTDYQNGGFDGYCGEKCLFMDEFKGQIPYNQLLIMLQGYKAQVHARYTNAYMLWDEVHITSVFKPSEVYKKMVTDGREVDNFEQLRRRIDYVVMHERNGNGEYIRQCIPMAEYYIDSDFSFLG